MQGKLTQTWTQSLDLAPSSAQHRALALPAEALAGAAASDGPRPWVTLEGQWHRNAAMPKDTAVSQDSEELSATSSRGTSKQNLPGQR